MDELFITLRRVGCVTLSGDPTGDLFSLYLLASRHDRLEAALPYREALAQMCAGSPELETALAAWEQARDWRMALPAFRRRWDALSEEERERTRLEMSRAQLIDDLGGHDPYEMPLDDASAARLIAGRHSDVAWRDIPATDMATLICTLMTICANDPRGGHDNPYRLALISCLEGALADPGHAGLDPVLLDRALQNIEAIMQGDPAHLLRVGPQGLELIEEADRAREAGAGIADIGAFFSRLTRLPVQGTFGEVADALSDAQRNEYLALLADYQEWFLGLSIPAHLDAIITPGQ